MDHATSPDIAADRQADRASFRLIAVFVFLSWVTLSLTDQIDAVKEGGDDPALLYWLTQGTSHLIVLGLALIFPVLLNRFPLNREGWPRALAGFVAGFAVFGVVHILAMVALRKLLWPLVFGEVYTFGLLQPINWVYELHKDAYTFALLATMFWFGRQGARRQLEKEGRREEAAQSGRLTLTSGGRIYMVKADEVRLARAAANYVEVHTVGGERLVRMTLAELERLLASAGDNHIRVHRSCLVHKSEIEALAPNGDGSATITLAGGETLQASRSYRGKVEAALAG